MIFLSVNTPTKQTGIGSGKASDLKWIEKSARQISEFAEGNTIVIEKSTIPVKTAAVIKAILCSSQNNNKNKKFMVLSNPEFLAEGTAIDDLENPERVLIGGEDDIAVDTLSSIYEKWIEPQKIIKTNLWSAELSKLTSNAFLAQRISSINSISSICEVTGADINEVSSSVGLDSRIGGKFLKAGPGFGGSCFKKDILNLVYLCNYYGLNEVANYWHSVLEINHWQQNRIFKIVVEKLFGTIKTKKISILGFAFKANTNDSRESPAIEICKKLLEEGAFLSIYDPKVNSREINNVLKNIFIEKENKCYGKWEISETIRDSILDSDAAILLTEWNEFNLIQWGDFSSSVRKPFWIFDTRDIVNKDKLKSLDINIWKLGESF